MASAPRIPGWRFIAFKPPMGHKLSLKYKDAVIDGNETWFRLEGAHIVLACPAWTSRAKDAYQFAAVQVLEVVLGERLATRIETIEVIKLPERPEQEGFRSLAQLVSAVSDA